MYSAILSHATFPGPCKAGVDDREVCVHVRIAGRDGRSKTVGHPPQAQLAGLLIALSGKILSTKDAECKSAASALFRMFTQMSRIAEQHAERYKVDPKKEDASTQPERGTGESQRGVRRNESVVREMAEGVQLSGLAKSGHETAQVMHEMDARELGISENQSTTQYRICTKRKFHDAFGPWGSQNDGARLGNPAANTDLYIVQNFKMARAVVLPNQARSID